MRRSSRAATSSSKPPSPSCSRRSNDRKGGHVSWIRVPFFPERETCVLMTELSDLRRTSMTSTAESRGHAPSDMSPSSSSDPTLGRALLASSSLPRRSLRCSPPLLVPPPLASAQTVDQRMFGEMRWRSIGPYRAGRTRAVAGVPSQPNVFYIGVCNGGVWKTTDFGRTWRPVFDDQPTGSIGAIAVSPSDPNVVYVASGEGLQRPDLSVGDGDLQIDRRRPHLDPPRPARRPADPADHRRPAQPRPRLRRGPRPSLRPERRAGHLPFARRRQELRARALRR